MLQALRDFIYILTISYLLWQVALNSPILGIYMSRRPYGALADFLNAVQTLWYDHLVWQGFMGTFPLTLLNTWRVHRNQSL